MRTEDYFRSISRELEAVRDRVRYMINDGHWPTDGEWKESVLRTIIKRSAPTTVSVGRGFVVNGTGCTSQLDILVYDNSHPVLYRDGDLVFISPAACRAIIEVKSKVTATTFNTACKQLAKAAEFVRRSRGGSRTFVGLFSYEAQSLRDEVALECLYAAANRSPYRVIDHSVLGSNKFVKWWATSPSNPRREHRSWHAYELTEMAAGYFIHNLLMHLSPDVEQENEAIWFPEQSKEARLIAERRISDA
jgi:hypothetical protein